MTEAREVTATFALTHARKVTLSLRRHLMARGKVTVTDGHDACAANLVVRIQRRRAGGGWATVRSVTTAGDGTFKSNIKDRAARYRALAPEVPLSEGTHICLKATSARVSHRHG